MALEIQIPAGPASTQRLRLGDDYYTIGLRWNARASAWVLDLGNSSGASLVQGVPVRVSRDLLMQYVGLDGLPPGAFVAIDTTGGEADPGLTDLGDRVKLYYLDPAELAGWTS